MKILFTGKSDFKYNRIRVLLAGLAELQDVELLYFPIISKTNFDKQAFMAMQNKADFIYIPLSGILMSDLLRNSAPNQLFSIR